MGANHWRAVKITEFERRQMKTLKDELDQEYKAQTGLGKQSSKEQAAAKLSSSSQT